ncbi:MAG: hypothetical protein HVK29_01700 [Pelagibacteraceae bacterium]|nr:hypothetical protein [Pelagibacteraceae bacterium]
MGLPHRWIVKSVIPLSMLLLVIAAVARLIQEIVLLLYPYKIVEDSTAEKWWGGELLRPQLRIPEHKLRYKGHAR